MKKFLRKMADQYVSKKYRAKLKNDNFSLLSSNCIGGG